MINNWTMFKNFVTKFKMRNKLNENFLTIMHLTKDKFLVKEIKF